ncbi:hypothetical protein [Myceligenerans xiligouense]|uniref:Uncharacterized protein n=1 Tax=Myceligenerans xiligouense TaxID=253184 RepID=A0A3N4YMD6_9MICO|nr:hypothetical protein [Myceligenerans xiligouense]RPF20474.1 hypothetical protein EDD34_1065 [Myceligenerans xiligouense]
MTVIRKVVAPLGASPAGTADRAGSRRRTSRVLAGLLALLLLAGIVAMLGVARTDAGPGLGSGAGPAASVPRESGQEESGQDRSGQAGPARAGRDAVAAALARSFVTEVDESTSTVTVDMSRNPEAVYAWMDETGTDLDGWTVEVSGLETPDSAKRAALDAASSKAEGDRPVEPQACPDLPAGARTDGASTVPYLGCDTSTGHEPRATPVPGGLRHSLGAAVDVVLAELMPGADLAASDATVTAGQAVVDLPAGFADAAATAPVPAYEIDRALIFTAYSNGALDSVRFRVAGDCLAYATAVDGDMCATVPLPVELDREK